MVCASAVHSISVPVFCPPPLCMCGTAYMHVWNIPRVSDCMCVHVSAHHTHRQRTQIRTMHLATAHCCHTGSTLPPAPPLPPTSILCLPTPAPSPPPPPSYLSERSRPLCAGTPQRSAGSRPGHVGSARGWWWSRGPRWLGYARPPGPDRWWGSLHWPELLHWPPHHHFA